MSSETDDPHQLCRICRGHTCSRESPCSECATWSVDQWIAFEEREIYLAIKRKRSIQRALAATSSSIETSMESPVQDPSRQSSSGKTTRPLPIFQTPRRNPSPPPLQAAPTPFSRFRQESETTFSRMEDRLHSSMTAKMDSMMAILQRSVPAPTLPGPMLSASTPASYLQPVGLSSVFNPRQQFMVVNPEPPPLQFEVVENIQPLDPTAPLPVDCEIIDMDLEDFSLQPGQEDKSIQIRPADENPSVSDVQTLSKDEPQRHKDPDRPSSETFRQRAASSLQDVKDHHSDPPVRPSDEKEHHRLGDRHRDTREHQRETYSHRDAEEAHRDFTPRPTDTRSRHTDDYHHRDRTDLHQEFTDRPNDEIESHRAGDRPRDTRHRTSTDHRPRDEKERPRYSTDRPTDETDHHRAGDRPRDTRDRTSTDHRPRDTPGRHGDSTARPTDDQERPSAADRHREESDRPRDVRDRPSTDNPRHIDEIRTRHDKQRPIEDKQRHTDANRHRDDSTRPSDTAHPQDVQYRPRDTEDRHADARDGPTTDRGPLQYDQRQYRSRSRHRHPSASLRHTRSPSRSYSSLNRRESHTTYYDRRSRESDYSYYDRDDTYTSRHSRQNRQHTDSEDSRLPVDRPPAQNRTSDKKDQKEDAPLQDPPPIDNLTSYLSLHQDLTQKDGDQQILDP